MQIFINKDTEFNFEYKNGSFFLNGKETVPDIISTGKNRFHLLLNNKSYSAEIISSDESNKTLRIKINGKEYDTVLKNKLDLLLEKTGMNLSVSSGVNEVKAPMPGLIAAVCVKEGDAVQEGDPLLVLEAMKMENIIKSPREGIVKLIHAKEGTSAEKNEVLIEFEKS